MTPRPWSKGVLALGAGLALLAGSPGAARAETQRVVLKGGEELFGEVRRVLGGDTVIVETMAGATRRLRAADIDRIESLGRAAEAIHPEAMPGPAPDAGEAPPAVAESATPNAAHTPPTGAPPAGGWMPPESPVKPWYVSQRVALLCAGCLVLALGGLSVVRRDTEGFAAGFKRVRVLLLLAALLAVGIYGVDVQARRAARAEWRRPLHVAVVLLAEGAEGAGHAEAFKARAADATAWLHAERARFQAGADVPAYFHVFGPVRAPSPPRPPTDDGAGGAEVGLFERLAYAFDLRRAVWRVDELAGVSGGRYDARMYVTVEAPVAARAPRFVEGVAEEGGELGLITVVLDRSMVDAAWIATLHETLHTVGATDKYGEDGHALVPEGLAEPALSPRFPQRFAEIMAGELPTGPGEGRIADRLDAVRVGEATARELHWK